MLDIYRDKKVLITGHTGFKGTWLSLWLSLLGADVVGLSDREFEEPSNFVASGVAGMLDDRRADVRDAIAVKRLVDEIQPDFIFHLAAQSLVRRSYNTPLETLSVNGLGTANVLEALRGLDKPVVAIMITSDKAYDNLEWKWGYRETDRIGGKDPYSASKGLAELVLQSYLHSFFTAPSTQLRLGIARAGNVIGGGDWAVDRIVPDCVRACARGARVQVRNPSATRPWQHVLEPLSGYLVLGQELARCIDFHGEAYNFGPPSNQNHTVGELIGGMVKYWPSLNWADVSSDKNPHEAGLLKLNCDKAFADLAWLPVLFFDETVRFTADWYKTFYEGSGSMRDFSLSQINEYTHLAAQRGILWAKC